MSTNDPQNDKNDNSTNETFRATGKRINEEASAAGEKFKQFVEDSHLNEQLEVAGRDVVNRVKDLIQEGNVRRLILRNPEGRAIIEIPLTAGVVAGGALLWWNPVLAGLGAIAALLTRVTIEIVREEPDAIIQDVKEKAKDIQRSVEDDK